MLSAHIPSLDVGSHVLTGAPTQGVLPKSHPRTPIHGKCSVCSPPAAGHVHHLFPPRHPQHTPSPGHLHLWSPACRLSPRRPCLPRSAPSVRSETPVSLCSEPPGPQRTQDSELRWRLIKSTNLEVEPVGGPLRHTVTENWGKKQLNSNRLWCCVPSSQEILAEEGPVAQVMGPSLPGGGPLCPRWTRGRSALPHPAAGAGSAPGPALCPAGPG